jgi:hypothetical protein
MLFVAARLARIGRKKKLNVFKKGRRAAVSINPPNARNSARMNERKSPIKKTKRDKTNNVQLKRDNPFSEDNIQITREHRDKFGPFARQAMKKSVIKKLI